MQDQPQEARCCENGNFGDRHQCMKQPQEAKAWWEDDKYWEHIEGELPRPNLEKIVAEATRRGRLECLEDLRPDLSQWFFETKEKLDLAITDHDMSIHHGARYAALGDIIHYIDGLITRLKNEKLPTETN